MTTPYMTSPSDATESRTQNSLYAEAQSHFNSIKSLPSNNHGLDSYKEWLEKHEEALVKIIQEDIQDGHHFIDNMGIFLAYVVSDMIEKKGPEAINQTWGQSPINLRVVHNTIDKYRSVFSDELVMEMRL